MSAQQQGRPRSRITRRQALGMFVSAGTLAGLGSLDPSLWFADDEEDAPFLGGRIIATGIAEASAVAPVGTFLPGGPIHDNPVLAAFAQPGRVLDPTRVLVGSTSNFGAPKANHDQAAGSLLSIATTAGDVLEVPQAFAGAGDQASALDGAVQMYTAESATWRNGFYTPGAVTARQTAVSNPLGLSINNAFGRLWR